MCLLFACSNSPVKLDDIYTDLKIQTQDLEVFFMALPPHQTELFWLTLCYFIHISPKFSLTHEASLETSGSPQEFNESSCV